MADLEVDVLIVGGGLIGASLMLALANTKYSALLIEAGSIEAKINSHFDARTLALSPASASILEALGIWSLLDTAVTPIHTIHVSEQRRFGAARIRGTAEDPLGYVVELHAINQRLQQVLSPKNIMDSAKLIALDNQQGLATVQCGDVQQVIKAQLIVAADGGQSTVRQLAELPVQTQEFNQYALVANIGLARDHQNWAYERFTQSGPMALLPMTENRAALVWCLPPEEAQLLQKMDELQLLKLLQQRFGYKLGRFIKSGKRSIFPLTQSVMQKQTDWPLVFVGNAAHTLHPVAGQGFNLGLRDIACLAQCIIQHGLDAAMLKVYKSMRQHDQMAILQLTKGLVNVFGSRLPGVGICRNLGLIAFDNSSFLKSILKQYARGYGGIVPDLACGIALEQEQI